MTPVFRTFAAVLSILTATPAVAADTGLHVVETLHVGGTGGWDYASFDGVARRLYLTHGTSIAAVDVDTGKVTPHLTDAQGAHIALPLGDGKTLLVTQGKAGKVSFVDAVSGANLADVAIGGKPDGAILDPATGHVFVLDNDGARLDAVDPKTRGLIGSIALKGAPEGSAVDGKGRLFIHFEDTNQLVVVDTRALTVTATYDLKDCEEASGLALVADQHLILSACKGGIARVTDADTGTEVATLAIGDRPDGALYDAATKRGYVPSGDGKLTVISFDGKPHVVDVVATKAGARTAALDPATGRVFLPTADFAPAPAGQRPPVVPDTFEVLVVGQVLVVGK